MLYYYVEVKGTHKPYGQCPENGDDMEIKFLDGFDDDTIKENAIRITVVCIMNGKVLYIKRRGKVTLELPSIEKAAGELPPAAIDRLLKNNLNTSSERPVELVCSYSCSEDASEYGMLYYADITSMRTLNDPELCGSYFLDQPPQDLKKWSNPEKDPMLLDKVMEFVKSK